VRRTAGSRDPAGRSPHGVGEQSASARADSRLLGISNFVVAATRWDLVGFDRGVLDRICADFGELLEGAYAQRIPLSALHGDNIRYAQ